MTSEKSSSRTFATRFLVCMAAMLLILAAGCAPKGPLPGQRIAGAPVADLLELSQDPRDYVSNDASTSLGSERQHELYEKYLTRFFGPWRMTKSAHTAREALWGLERYGSQPGYGENTLRRGPEFMDELRRESRPEAFPSEARRAITLRNTSMRVLPTNRPYFEDFDKAGEGFPFDYFQNTAVWVGTPVFISHVSASKAWLYAETAFASGWVPAEDVAFVSDSFVDEYQTGDYAALVEDDVPVTDPGGRYVFTAHVGAVFPRFGHEDAASAGGYDVMVPVADTEGNAVIKMARLKPTDAVVMPLTFTSRNMAEVARVMVGREYGWGGLYEDRDCSSLLKDLFTPFGVWLPRNSRQQSKVGVATELKDLDREAKKERIIAEGLPFRSLLHMPGHIMLYLGEREGEPIVLHAVWGLRTKSEEGAEGRKIIGRAAITTTSPGMELELVQRSGYDLLTRIDIMNDPLARRAPKTEQDATAGKDGQ
ncbi:SH3 domain-containing protein [Oceanidesulfovibrio marinus]|uniref:Glycoside hydrolase n=1 Tax=Oceanidesulfovibrio marinus TaxID=370038 RepID=A0ABX6NDJ2_9BACT|nr:SH3 domain-containing protein [Oceanidesulfovibrio marinus]QJT08673.1 glycoside hydrolase [Oceanidesulfovibrio marinus]